MWISSLNVHGLVDKAIVDDRDAYTTLGSELGSLFNLSQVARVLCTFRYHRSLVFSSASPAVDAVSDRSNRLRKAYILGLESSTYIAQLIFLFYSFALISFLSFLTLASLEGLKIT